MTIYYVLRIPRRLVDGKGKPSTGQHSKDGTLAWGISFTPGKIRALSHKTMLDVRRHC
jgi:hypothetical protein